MADKDEDLCDLYTKGIRRHIFKEDDSTIPRARRRYKIIKGVWVSLRCGFWLIVVSLFLKRFWE